MPHEDPVGCVNVVKNQILVGEKRCFAFDAVLDMDSTASDLRDLVADSHAQTLYDGFNVAIIAYGQTGAGKTHTMTHLSSDLFDLLFQRFKESGEQLGEDGVAAKLTVVEVYNEAIGDLLNPDSRSGESTGGLKLREVAKDDYQIRGLTEVSINSREQLQALLDSATKNRKTASTLQNLTSSRSHCVVTLTLTRKGVVSRCSLVDLAGSERLKKTYGFVRGVGVVPSGGASVLPSAPFPSDPSKGSESDSGIVERAKEGISINGGLLALGNVIVALCEKHPHIPFRSSKLTRLLQPVLSGNCKVAMISCVSPLSSSFEETLNTLKYSDRAKNIKTSPHLVPSSASSVQEAQEVILRLTKEVESLRVLAGRTPTSPSPLINRKPHPFSRNESVSGQVAQNELIEIRALLQMEKNQCKRLEDELFNAEYTAMVETEKRKDVENRVEELEELLAAAQERLSSLENFKIQVEEPHWRSRRELQVPPVDRKIIQQLEGEKAQLVAAKERLQAEVERLSQALSSFQQLDQRASIEPHASTSPPSVEKVCGTLLGVVEELQQAASASVDPQRLSAIRDLILRCQQEYLPFSESSAPVNKEQLRVLKEELERVHEQVHTKEDEIKVARQNSMMNRETKPVTAVASTPPSTTSRTPKGNFSRDGDSFQTGRTLNAVQDVIEEELKILEDLEHEIHELEEYKQMMAAAGCKDDERWSKAIQGYRQRLAEIAVKQKLPSLSKEEMSALHEESKSLKSRLKKVEIYQSAVDQARLQLDEVNRRVESLDDARKFHLRRVLRLQNQGRADELLDSAKDTHGPPSVREITTSRTRYSRLNPVAASPAVTPSVTPETKPPLVFHTIPPKRGASARVEEKEA